VLTPSYAGNMLQGIYKDVCPPPGSDVRICGHDSNGNQIPCGSSCPQAAKCYDPTIAYLRAGVFGNVLLSSSTTTSVSADLKIDNISLIFGQFHFPFAKYINMATIEVLQNHSMHL
jgi:hypothetical protein